MAWTVSGDMIDQDLSTAWRSFLYWPVEGARVAIFKIDAGKYRDRNLGSRALICNNFEVSSRVIVITEELFQPFCGLWPNARIVLLIIC